MPATTSSVQYVLDAPLCSMKLGVEFLIDGAVVGSDTFSVNFGFTSTDPNAHSISREFLTTPGTHRIGARRGTLSWPDTVVTFTPQMAFRDSLPFYCS